VGAIAKSSALVLVVAVALVASGCGSKKSQPETTTDWANSLCTSFSTWQDSVTSAATLLTSGNLSVNNLKETWSSVKKATSTLESEVKSLGKPPTKAGDQAQAELQTLSTQMQADTAKINDAVNQAQGVAGVISAVAVASTTAQSMKNQIVSTYNNLQTIDPSGELKTAFNQASDCTSLRKSISSTS
jgi:hypothetical protein